MKNTFYFLLICCALTACGQAAPKSAESTEPTSKNNSKFTPQTSADLAAEIKALENKLLAIQNAKKDPATATAMIEKSELYAHSFPSDSLSPYLLFRAGDVARGAGQTKKAIELWNIVWHDYEYHPIAPGSLFAQAFTYDAELGNKEEAQRYYQKFMKQYPNHQLIDQVRQLLSLLDKSPEELVRDFKNKK
ncbi:MAG: tetratricopeptide (TPR) repeat protein [Paraglaciecola sp.]|jgi:tetratricopeptide (TPR) repeat protein